MSALRTEHLLIDGEWRAAADGAVIEVENPADLSIVATVPRAGEADLEAALAAAERVQDDWARTPAWTRSELLRGAARNIMDRQEEIARLLTQEQGKPLHESRAEVATAAEQFEWYADEARRIYGRVVDGTTDGVRIEVRKEPIGPVAAFTPWNFPVMLAARKLAPALAAGCPIILKPAEESPSACLAMVRAIQDSGFPAGVIAAVTGDPAQISERLISSKVIRKVSLTGSVRVGRQLMQLASQNLAAISLELGGHGPVIVCDDVDVAQVAQLSARTKFRNAGQVCISPTRFLVARSIYEQFVEEFAAVARDLTLGDGSTDGVDVGPMCSRRRHDDFAALVEDATSRGAIAVTGGQSLAEAHGGHFYAPTVLRDIPAEARILQEEPFGPVALLIPYDTLDDAVRIANDTEYGLAGYLFTNDLGRAQLLSERVRVGMLGVNSYLVSTAVAPFSGVGLSGLGAENGTEGIEHYLHPKTVVTGIPTELS
ncbi:succinate-semialdehyde dehydrogenase/glutarate-semialdehyde dehydrogenase [Microbacterium sp. W4I4]|uniref:NAD-dependent succinate-semialdehyde dehydrogenase n=1 Tax=Microbacterium sp. W4I4 TaxID=3042295 RepID=UPI00278ADF16|nr:NAD-dependent succinate-semialdehyde dehydrogenase [Microbacterium sp. W4I4]MDQ0615520.1 succinate-semialdehyde dehydrogenase/glutarate-semialdehyde dehydrogenase [Microbacterium sp. W4I4]